MKHLLVILLAAVSLGFMIDTPESIREREKENRAWKKGITKAYDLKALHAFLEAQIRVLAVVDGVDLRHFKIDEQWKFDENYSGLTCGNWNFWTKDVKSPEFTLLWNYEERKKDDGTVIQKSIELFCQRKSKATFVLDSAKRAEEECVILSP